MMPVEVVGEKYFTAMHGGHVRQLGRSRAERLPWREGKQQVMSHGRFGMV